MPLSENKIKWIIIIIIDVVLAFFL
jgi:hypothetical protein